jgi:hypothetical protein
MLFVTGYSETRRIRGITQDHILKKPFRQAELAEKLRHILQPADRRNGRGAERRRQPRSDARPKRARAKSEALRSPE